MENPTLRTALLVVCATIGIIARATDCPLTTPPPSSYPDTECSVNVAVTNWPSLGRRVKLTLSANFTPSNCVQIAFGQDSDSDGDLAPEETHLILGVDCGEPFARWEVVVGSRSPTIDVTDSTVGLGLEPTTNPTPTPSLGVSHRLSPSDAPTPRSQPVAATIPPRKSPRKSPAPESPLS